MKNLSQSLTAFVALWFFLLLSCSAPIAPVNVDAAGVALKGYDPVAYFTKGQPVKGQPEYQFQWQNATWLFASSEHLALFQKDPARYAPQYGGY